MTAKTYTLMMEPLDPQATYAMIRQRVEQRGEHFALRRETCAHPAGEGLLTETWVVDHIPSGRAELRP